MQKKKFVTIFLSIILFIAIAVLGVANVYRVDSVSVKPSTISAQAQVEAEELQQRLSEAYVGSNTLFVGQGEAETILEDFPYFRLTGFKKEFPNHLVFEVKEDEEMFAVKVNGVEEYCILGIDGVYLGKRANPENRSGNNPDVIVNGLAIDSELGKVVSGSEDIVAFLKIITAINAVDEMGGSMRSNVTEISFSTEISDMPCVTLQFKEGVRALIFDYPTNTAEKADAVTRKYFSLADNQKVTGEIAAIDTPTQLYVHYYPGGYPQATTN